MFRKIIFWLHLCSGITAGLVVFMMSFTGVILTYERQLIALEDRAYARAPAADEQRLPLDSLLSVASAIDGFEPDRLIVSSNPAMATEFVQGRSRTEFLDPYTGATYTQHEGNISAFMSTVRGWHRWFNRTGEDRATARAITGTSNLLFLFLLCSGIYLWLPAIINRTTLRLRILFNRNATSGPARSFNWHHVFGFWAVVPLIVIVATATVFYYSWANTLVYRLAGDEVPSRAGGGEATAVAEPIAPVQPIALDRVVAIATAQVDSWNTLSITLPAATAPEFTIAIDQGNGGQPQKRHNLTLAADSGEVLDWAPFTSQSSGRQARSWVRFLHTGEALGIGGQTVAGLASFAALFMVWTGFELSWNRLQNYRARVRRRRLEARTGSVPIQEAH